MKLRIGYEAPPTIFRSRRPIILVLNVHFSRVSDLAGARSYSDQPFGSRQRFHRDGFG